LRFNTLYLFPADSLDQASPPLEISPREILLIRTVPTELKMMKGKFNLLVETLGGKVDFIGTKYAFETLLIL